MQPSDSISLIQGVTIAGMRETSQPSPQGAIVQGQAVTIRLPSGATSTVFIPNVALANKAAIANALNERAEQLMGIENLGG